MHKNLLFIMVMTILIILSCSSTSNFVVITPEGKTKTFEKEFNLVWNGTLGILIALDLPILTIEKESGIISTDFVSHNSNTEFSKNIIQLGTLEESRQIRYKLNILITENNQLTSVKINSHIEKYSKPLLENYSWRPQESNGYIEQMIFEKLSNL